MLKSKIFLLLLLLSSVSALAQEPSFSYEVPKKYCVKEVRVSGIKFLNPDVLVSVSGISVGDSILVPGDAVTKAIKKLWSQGLFSDIKISATKIENSDIYLDIFLQEQPRISSINFVGVRKGEVSDLKEKLKLRNGSQLTESILENSVEIIRKHYRTKGFLNVDVNPIQENDTALANMVKLTFDIRKNERVKIDQITFDGNTAFTDARLRKSLKKNSPP